MATPTNIYEGRFRVTLTPENAPHQIATLYPFTNPEGYALEKVQIEAFVRGTFEEWPASATNDTDTVKVFSPDIIEAEAFDATLFFRDKVTGEEFTMEHTPESLTEEEYEALADWLIYNGEKFELLSNNLDSFTSKY